MLTGTAGSRPVVHADGPLPTPRPVPVHRAAGAPYTVSVTTPTGGYYRRDRPGHHRHRDADPGQQPRLCWPAAARPDQFRLLPPVTIGNSVWNANANGVQDTGEPGIPNVTSRSPAHGAASGYATTTTDASGLYQFADPGTYTVTVTTPAGLRATTSSRAPPPPTATVAPAPPRYAGQRRQRRDPRLRLLSARDHRQLCLERPQRQRRAGYRRERHPEVTLTLTGRRARPLGHATTTTDANGLYQFTEPPGTYTVAVTTPSAATCRRRPARAPPPPTATRIQPDLADHAGRRRQRSDDRLRVLQTRQPEPHHHAHRHNRQRRGRGGPVRDDWVLAQQERSGRDQRLQRRTDIDPALAPGWPRTSRTSSGPQTPTPAPVSTA